MVPGDYRYDSGAQALRSLAERGKALPDAIVCANDVMAFGCMDVARYQLQLRIPQDLSIVGFDGVGAARWDSYNLTTVQQPVARMAEAAVSMIMERIENPQLPPEKRTFSGSMIAGGSARLRRN